MVPIINNIKRCFSYILSNLMGILIRAHQWLIAPILPKTCRFYPSCSEYSLAAIQQYGAVKGAWKSLYRLLRCNPWSTGGYDPVLPNKEKC